MTQLKSLFQTHWPVWGPIIALALLLLVLVVSKAARQAGKSVLRLISRPLLLAAVVALVYDGTRTIGANSGVIVTSLGEHWGQIAPATLQVVQAAIRRLHPLVWDAGIVRLLRLPSWFVLGFIGLTLAWLGRKRAETNIYVN